MNKSSRATLLLLHSISSRLSTREDCRNVQYTVYIDAGHVTMEPIMFTYPDRYHRKESDKMTVVEYAINRVVANGLSEFQFVDGEYTYSKIGQAKNRVWTRTR